MILNVPTLVFINGLLCIIAAILLTANWRMNKHVKGTKEWALTQWLWALGILFLLPREVFPPTFTIVFANTLIFIGYLIYLRGMSRYQGVASTPLVIEIIVILVAVQLLYYYAFVQPDLSMRVVVISTFVVAISMRVFIILWPTLKSSGGMGTVIGVGLLFHALFFLSRIIVTGSIDNGKPMLEGGGGSAWILAENILFTFWCTASFAMLTNLVLQKDLQKLADRDPLTNLLNRRAVFEECQKLIDEESDAKVSILVLDLDHFKLVNDNYGHATGDKVLQHFANVVSKEAPATNLFGRTGGEEFILVLPDTCIEAAERKADYLCRKIRDAKVVIDKQKIDFTVSIGVAYAHLKTPEDLRQLIKHADKAMYFAKHNGRDQIAVYNAEAILEELGRA